MARNNAKYLGMALIGMTLALAAGCSSDTDQTATPADSNTSGKASAPSGTELRDAIRAQLLPGIEAAYASRKAKAWLDGGVVHVRMEGDVSANRAGWSECRMVTQLISKDQRVIIEFPNGAIDCAELLAASE